MKTIVYQSHSPSKLRPWMESCTESVRGWSASVGADYEFVGDELFDLIPKTLYSKFCDQPIVLTDLARLRLMLGAFKRGYQRVIWMDADILIFDPDVMELPTSPHAVGREVWVQPTKGKLQAYKKVHNAFLMTSKQDSFLPFYAEAAERLLLKVVPPVVPQFIGPKWLSAQHNISALHVMECAGMLSPLALADICAGGGAALGMTVDKHTRPLAAFNLSASCLGKTSDGICNSEADYERAVERLLANGLPT